ncbi:UNVERIFIED_CONTAM: hypothetical protein HDU68_001437 [Siphonaria sp. JEL0065]|nr:hypothetical protein HDU68_001437 [Siphonaria sp. JEL0065]
MNNAIQLAKLVAQKATSKAGSIKNRGCLNPAYVYFSCVDGSLVTGASTVLSDASVPKYYTVAADMLVFSATLSHVLMIFRCPHDKKSNKTCKDNVLDSTSFQYKGCLATPGGFFDAKLDLTNNGATPDYHHSALRELNEECSNFFASSSLLSDSSNVHFVSCEFNNFRDVRWFTSKNYVPTLATQFTTRLTATAASDSTNSAPSAPNNSTSLPTIKGSDDACGNAYWVDVRIIEKVYNSHQSTYNSFDDNEFDESKFDAFIRNPTYFVLDPSTNLPRNKLESENTLLKDLDETLHVVDFDEGKDYLFSDFAFDHVRNIVQAKKVLIEKGKQSLV